MSEVVLYDYWRSSAAYRVRIALSLKGMAHRSVAIDLVAGDQAAAEYRALNPQGLVPALAIDGLLLTQSLAIMDYLEAICPQPALLPTDPAARAKVLAQALIIVADIHPLNNLRIRNYLTEEFGQDQAGINRWAQRWISRGFDVLEAQAPEQGLFGGATPNLVDVCLVPQIYNAAVFQTDLSPYPRLVRIDAALREIPAIAAASPDSARP